VGKRYIPVVSLFACILGLHP